MYMADEIGMTAPEGSMRRACESKRSHAKVQMVKNLKKYLLFSSEDVMYFEMMGSCRMLSLMVKNIVSI